jgi:hypothetical protein
MQPPPLDPDVADAAPSDSVLTVYDEQHTVTYLRLLDADAEGADWRDVARIVRGPVNETARIAAIRELLDRRPRLWQVSTGHGDLCARGCAYSLR